MKKKLPPLKTLPCFSICAKTKSFTKAAAEINLTQGAISKQIAALESYLGLKLFVRKAQILELTKEAKIYLKQVEMALKNIEIATAKIIKTKEQKKSKEILNINVLTSASSAWLIPLLPDFHQKFPAYDVVVKTGNDEVDFDKLSCHLAIRVAQQKSKASWKKFHSKKIMGEKLLCVASPSFWKKNKIKKAADLLKYNLLEHTYRPKMWQKYLNFLGVKKFTLHHDSSFEHFFMLVEAAKNGLGIGLVPEFLIKKELKNKELVEVLSGNFKSNYGYFLLWKKQKNLPQKISDFIAWIDSISQLEQNNK